MEFKKLSEVEVVAEPTKSANVLIEEDGEIKKIPKDKIGGVGTFVLQATYGTPDFYTSEEDRYDYVGNNPELYKAIEQGMPIMIAIDRGEDPYRFEAYLIVHWCVYDDILCGHPGHTGKQFRFPKAKIPHYLQA